MTLLLQAMRSFLDAKASFSIDCMDLDFRDAVRRNRLAPLLAHVAATCALDPESDAWLKSACHAAMGETAARAAPLRMMQEQLDGIRWLILRGPVLGAALYGDVFLRPFGDLDLLVPEADVLETLRRLDEAGAVPLPGALEDAYYLRHHLHVQRYLPGPVRPVLMEVHWRVDHPYTLYTPDLNGLFARARQVSVLDAATPMPDSEDLLLLLAMHALKHAVWLPVWVEQGRVPRLLEEGGLMSLLDLALLCRRATNLDWALAQRRAVAWGAEGAVRTCLDGIEALWPGFLTEVPRERFAPGNPGRLRRLCERWGTTGAPPSKRKPSRLWRWKRGGVFRLVRLLDLAGYFWPPPDYFDRRYGEFNLRRRLRHAISACRALGENGLALWRAQGNAIHMEKGRE